MSDGETKSAVELSERLLSSGFPVEGLIHEGLTAALRSLDAKCTNEEFNLLEIMLAGRAMMAIMDKVVAKYLPLENREDVKGLKLPDPLKHGRMPVVIEACRRLRESAGNECVIAACVLGPMSIASQIMGLEGFLYQLVDNPDGVSQVLDFAEKVAVSYGRAIIKAGAHCPVVFDPVASPAVIPPSLFVHYEAQRLKRIYDSFRAEGAPISWISIAGATQKIMPYFKKAGINLATIDYVVPISEAFMSQ